MALRRLELSEALGEEYAATFARLQRMFRARGVPAEDAADLAQETATRLLGYLERHGGIADDPGPLIHRIATNLLIDRSRSSDRRVVSLDPAEHDAPAPVDVLEEVRARHRRRVVRRAVGNLSERQRDAIVLSLDGHSPVEIADHMGLERNAADALLFRARKTLAGRLAHMREELSAFTLLATLKLRSAARRGAGTSNGGQFAVTAPALAHFVSAALVLVLGGLSGASTPAYAATTVRTALVPVTRAAPEQPHNTAPKIPAAPGGNARIIDPRAHRVHVETHVPGPSGEALPVAVDVWHERDEVHRGAAGPMLDVTTQQTCSARSVENLCSPGARR